MNPTRHLRSVVDSDGAVILDVEHSAVTRLNALGGFVWERLERGKLIDEIVLELAIESNTDIVTVDRDVRSFIRDLTSFDLVHNEDCRS